MHTTLAAATAVSVSKAGQWMLLLLLLLLLLLMKPVYTAIGLYLLIQRRGGIG